ncbi:MAG: hypothetical protein Q9219_006103 [cf. Caloplaca sp. 3 TL-2023]
MSAVNLAWAVEANYIQLAARLQAYAETKAAITTFQACVRASTGSCMSSLPYELIRMVSDELKDTIYRKKIKKWLRAQKCIENSCKTQDHFSNAEWCSIKYGCREFHENYHYEVLDEIATEKAEEIHWVRSRKYLKMLEQPPTGASSKGFGRCKEIMLRDFGVMPNFNVTKSYECHEPYDAIFDGAEVRAWLSIPVIPIELRSEKGVNEASFVMETKLDFSQMSSASSKVNTRKIKSAITALRLSAPHTIVTEEVEECSYSTEDFEPSDEDQISEELSENELAEEESAENNGTESTDDQLDADESVKGILAEKNPIHNETADHDLSFKENKLKQGKIPKYHTRCLECGTDECQGKYEFGDLHFMILGSGVLPAYSVDYEDDD